MFTEPHRNHGIPAALVNGDTPHRRQRGGSLIEYCLLLALISLMAIGALGSFGTARDNVFARSASSIVGP